MTRAACRDRTAVIWYMIGIYVYGIIVLIVCPAHAMIRTIIRLCIHSYQVLLMIVLLIGDRLILRRGATKSLFLLLLVVFPLFLVACEVVRAEWKEPT